MKGYPRISVYALALFFVCFALHTPAVFADAEQASSGLLSSPSSSIKITVSKQTPSTIRLQVKQAPLPQI